MDELKRWSAHLDIPMNFTPAYFPADASLASRMVHACNEQGEMDKAATLSDALLLAVWNEEKNVADEDTLVTIAKSCSIDGGDELFWGQDRISFLEKAIG